MNDIIKNRAVKMRRNQSYAERVMWKILRNRRFSGFKFRRQYIIEPYIVDFICLHKKLIIEVDGYSHDYQVTYDRKRTAYLNKLGYRVIRFTNSKLLSQDCEVMTSILHALHE